MDDTAQSPQNKPADFQQMYNAGGRFKEQLEAIASSFRAEEQESRRVKEVTAVEEIPTNPEAEIEGYIEKVEKEAELAKPVVDDYTQQVLVGSAAPQKPKVTLPLTDDQIKQGLHHKVWEAIRWLAEWCARQLKMIRNRN